ncbi:hypothetical protein [Flammeovirga sp. SJP92]|uniref:hypothetical protein n=1 Tax=Flammeovirga sp. SJP92 TaxID=1775430 RepID=UPI000786AC4E|nr:hypothetical protein [Flammeovirga sp. SJP92]KXX69402.1 hypothetical protein AVL50_19165 [Flammeovirga sp. SJP92]
MTNYLEPYSITFGRDYDFKVKYELLNPEQGGRVSPAFQGIKWDFGYQHEAIKSNQLFMIYPEFEDGDGNILSNEKPIPPTGIARMFIFRKSKINFHKEKIHVGIKGTFNEGKPIGKCEVIEINFKQQ